MRLIVLRCGAPDFQVPELAAIRELVSVNSLQILDVTAVPTRRELRPVDEAAQEILPVDLTPTLEEISARPDVDHLDAPAFAPQQPEEELRVVVVGTDAALSAVLTRMMRSDYLWATVGYVPLRAKSPAAMTWSLPADPQAAFRLAVAGSVRPVPTIRTDTSLVVAGSAAIAAWDGGSFVGEIVVDDETLVLAQERQDTTRFFGRFGARLVPTTDAPGIAAVRMTTPAEVSAEQRGRRGLRGALGRWMAGSLSPAQVQAWSETAALAWLVDRAPVETGGVDSRSLLTGRAVQSGGSDIAVTVDGIRGERPVKRVTFYRHLRDLQVVRI